jgi:hypothetical protein
MKTAILICFSLSITLFAQSGTESHVITEKDPAKIISRISYNLEILEQEYLSKLSYRDYVRAKDILIETYNLVRMIPIPPSPPPPDPIVTEIVPIPMSEEEFQQMVNGINSEAFEEGKLSVVQISAKHNYFMVSQVVRVIDLFSFSNGKIKSLEYLYPKVIDKYNSHQIINAFTYYSDKEAALEIINRY